MFNLNKFIGIGKIITDLDIRSINGSRCVEFTIIMNEPYRNKDRDWDEVSTPILVQFWGKGLAEYIYDKYIKGDVVYIEGSLRRRVWEKDGEKRFTYYVRGDSIKTVKLKPRDEIDNRNVDNIDRSNISNIETVENQENAKDPIFDKLDNLYTKLYEDVPHK